MLNVEIKEKEMNIEAGQIRYNDTGMHVLIVHSNPDEKTFDAIIVDNGRTMGTRFTRNSVNQPASSIMQVYPLLANATLTIN